MSSVEGIGSSGLDMTQFLQNLIRQRQQEGTSSARPIGPPSEEQRAEFESRFADALKAVGVSEEDVAAIQDEIHAAITEAKENHDGTSDPRADIKAAIDSVLTEHGIDPDQVRDQLGPPPGGLRPSPGSNASAMYGSNPTLTGDGSLAQLLSSSEMDDSTYALLQSLLLRVDTTV